MCRTIEPAGLGFDVSVLGPSLSAIRGVQRLHASHALHTSPTLIAKLLIAVHALLGMALPFPAQKVGLKTPHAIHCAVR
jgi:hypothetical protein